MKPLQPSAHLRLLSLVLLVAACSGGDGDEAPHAEFTCPHDVEPVRIKGGSYMVGSEGTYPEEGPEQEVTIASFRIEPTEVTVARFRQFVEETDYKTVAERLVDPALVEDYNLTEEEREEFLSPGGAVFRPIPGVAPKGLNWWKYVPGANWRYPRGPANPAAKPDEPVTQIAYEDAEAFAEWAGGRLPTEVEWEIAATAGKREANRNTQAPGEANTWQGIFPVQNSNDDGYEGVAPVGCFKANAYGLHDMIGNVWEWTADPYRVPRISAEVSGTARIDAPRTIKGGSFLCADNYCMRYRPAARQAQETGMGTNHIGFRVAYD